jgi:hypothetical protein
MVSQIVERFPALYKLGMFIALFRRLSYLVAGLPVGKTTVMVK